MKLKKNFKNCKFAIIADQQRGNIFLYNHDLDSKNFIICSDINHLRGIKFDGYIQLYTHLNLFSLCSALDEYNIPRIENISELMNMTEIEKIVNKYYDLNDRSLENKYLGEGMAGTDLKAMMEEYAEYYAKQCLKIAEGQSADFMGSSPIRPTKIILPPHE